MAKYEGIFDIFGTLKGMTFYKTKDGVLVRTKGGVSKERIKNDPAFQRTRENGAEFAHSAQAGLLLRKSVGPLLKIAKDRRVTSRLVKVMSEVKNQDSISARGARKVEVGLANPEGKQAIKSFDFNINAKMSTVLRPKPSCDTLNGEVSIVDFDPINSLALPEGTTHVSLRCAVSRIDFVTGDYLTVQSPETNLPISAATQTITLDPGGLPPGTDGFLFFYLWIGFYQDINGVQYPLKNHVFNMMHLLEVTD